MNENLEETEANLIDSKSINYLVFEGGGGKGNAYLGAIQVLEEVNVLPLHNHARTTKNN